jgi:hypothetical protein
MNASSAAVGGIVGAVVPGKLARSVAQIPVTKRRFRDPWVAKLLPAIKESGPIGHHGPPSLHSLHSAVGPFAFITKGVC